MFDWLRLKVRNAVLGGIADAVDILERQGASASDDAPQVLEERVRLLPAPEDRQVEKKRGKSAG